MSAADPVEDAADQLYAASPDEFMSLRGELVTAAKADGDTDTAKAIGALRKPTVAAAVVNRYALDAPDAVARLSELGDRLRRAHHDLDAGRLRELTSERRTLVAEVTAAAFDHVERDDPPTALREEVAHSFDAAVADPAIAERLGRLLRPEQFSGFGIAPGPELTLVRGGAESAPSPSKPSAPAEKKKQQDAPKDRRLTRAAERARAAFTDADEKLTAAGAAEQRAHEQVTTLTGELAELQRELDAAKRDLDNARKATRTAKSKRREAQSALDRAERQLS